MISRPLSSGGRYVTLAYRFCALLHFSSASLAADGREYEYEIGRGLWALATPPVSQSALRLDVIQGQTESAQAKAKTPRGSEELLHNAVPCRRALRAGMSPLGGGPTVRSQEGPSKSGARKRRPRVHGHDGDGAKPTLQQALLASWPDPAEPGQR